VSEIIGRLTDIIIRFENFIFPAAINYSTPLRDKSHDCDIIRAMNNEENNKFLLELANTKMPFGKYSGRYLINLPETYVLWFKQKGFPKGKLGLMLESLHEIQLNGLEALVRTLIKR
jgi:uncharacterized protein